MINLWTSGRFFPFYTFFFLTWRGHFFVIMLRRDWTKLPNARCLFNNGRRIQILPSASPSPHPFLAIIRNLSLIFSYKSTLSFVFFSVMNYYSVPHQQGAFTCDSLFSLLTQQWTHQFHKKPHPTTFFYSFTNYLCEILRWALLIIAISFPSAQISDGSWPRPTHRWLIATDHSVFWKSE